MKIHKYQFPLLYGDYDAYIPGYVRCLSVGQQGDNVSVWVISDSACENVEFVQFAVCCTGRTIPPGFFSHYIGTIQEKLEDGELVYHVFSNK